MMCSTASVQVCLDAGTDDAEVAERWRALHAWLPVLTGLFANSPSDGWRCTRTAVWSAIDPTRTAAPGGPDPRSAYARWALDAQLLAIRAEDGPWTAPAGLTFRGWLRGERPGLPAPTRADLDFHLTTLFPPVRAQGHLELRAIDAQPDDGWRVVTALVAALLDDPAARAGATAAAHESTVELAVRAAATRGGAGPAGSAAGDPEAVVRARALEVAARDAMTDPVLRRAALCFIETATGALTRAGLPEVAREVQAFGERYPARSRCPADDRPTAPEEGA